MFKNLCLAASLVFASATAAQACSYHIPPNFNFQYETLKQGKLQTRWAWREKRAEKALTEILSNLEIFVIARPAEDKILTDLPDTWWTNKNDEREYRRIRWDVVRYIKGNSPTSLYVRRPDGKVSPVLAQNTETIASKMDMSQSLARENFIKDTNAHLIERNSFPFWDAPVLKNIDVIDVTQFTTCGEVSIHAFDFNRSYLVGIANNGATAFAEPLSDENDPLIAGFERLVTTGQFSPDISVRGFLSEMEFRDVVEIKSCGLDLQNRNAISDNWKPYGEGYQNRQYNSNRFEFGQEIKFSRVGVSTKWDINIDDLSSNYPALLEYFDKDKSKVTCQPGEQFAVYGDTDIHGKLNHFSYPQTIPKYRFARIENGSVRVDDILTNYNLTGPTHISITEFRSPSIQSED